jgi:hypothetical protein
MFVPGRGSTGVVLRAVQGVYDRLSGVPSASNGTAYLEAWLRRPEEVALEMAE